MAERTIEIALTGQVATTTNTIDDIVSNTQKYLKVHVTQDTTWDNILLVAVFTANSVEYPIAVDPTAKTATVPGEVLMGDSFTVGFYGGTADYILTTNALTITLDKSVRVRFCKNPSYMEICKELLAGYSNFKSDVTDEVQDLEDAITAHNIDGITSSDGVHGFRIHEGWVQYLNGTTWTDTGYVTNVRVTETDGLQYHNGTNWVTLESAGDHVSDMDDVKDIIGTTYVDHTLEGVTATPVSYQIDTKYGAYISIACDMLQQDGTYVRKRTVYMITGSTNTPVIKLFGDDRDRISFAYPVDYEQTPNVTNYNKIDIIYNPGSGTGYDNKIKVCSMPKFDVTSPAV